VAWDEMQAAHTYTSEARGRQLGVVREVYTAELGSTPSSPMNDFGFGGPQQLMKSGSMGSDSEPVGLKAGDQELQQDGSGDALAGQHNGVSVSDDIAKGAQHVSNEQQPGQDTTLLNYRFGGPSRANDNLSATTSQPHSVKSQQLGSTAAGNFINSELPQPNLDLLESELEQELLVRG